MERAFKCDLCSDDFISPSELDHHIAREHAKPSSTPKKNFMCSMCDHAFRRDLDLVRHMRTHTGERPFKCTADECGKAFKRESTLKDHIKVKHSEERPLKCHFPGCEYAAKIATALSQHKKAHSDDRPFACSECEYRTNRNNHLQRHRMRHPSAGIDFKCGHPQCTKSFKTSIELKSHFNRQHEERNLQCDHPGCGRKFAHANGLNEHKRKVHSTKSLLCPNVNCNYRANTKWKLASHMKVHDVTNEKLSCSVEGCQYKGNNSRALQEHMRLHRACLPCPESGCSHYATTKAALNSHLKLHNSSGRPFKCPLCSKYYPTLSKLQDHCFAHTNEKPFACGQCVYSASFRSDVKKHISSAHANVKFPFIVHLLDDRECLDCKVTLPTSEFLLHCEGHVDQVAPEP